MCRDHLSSSGGQHDQGRSTVIYGLLSLQCANCALHIHTVPTVHKGAFIGQCTLFKLKTLNVKITVKILCYKNKR